MCLGQHRMLDDRIEPGVQTSIWLREVDEPQVKPFGREVINKGKLTSLLQQPFCLFAQNVLFPKLLFVCQSR